MALDKTIPRELAIAVEERVALETLTSLIHANSLRFYTSKEQAEAVLRVLKKLGWRPFGEGS